MHWGLLCPRESLNCPRIIGNSTLHENCTVGCMALCGFRDSPAPRPRRRDQDPYPTVAITPLTRPSDSRVALTVSSVLLECRETLNIFASGKVARVNAIRDAINRHRSGVLTTLPLSTLGFIDTGASADWQTCKTTGLKQRTSPYDG